MLAARALEPPDPREEDSMPFYDTIRARTVEGHRTLERLLELRRRLADEVPTRTLNDTLLLATWNIRDFDKPAYGRRLQESIHYIAEIISHFDLVAVQEVYKDLSALERVMDVLGSHWDYLVTDETMGGHGNDERMAFVYDSRKVSFQGLAGEMVLPPMRVDGEEVPVSQIWRTPYIAGFRAGWTRFMLTTVHITWGGSSATPAERVQEIEHVANFLKGRAEDPAAWSPNLILLGDFNIFQTEDATFQKITEAGFEVPEQIQELPSNALRTRHYDQIAFRARPGYLDRTGRAGVFDYYRTVFRWPAEGEPDTPETNDEALYREAMEPGFSTKVDGTPRSDESKRNYFKTYWRTHQMSDHLPMWVELRINYTDDYLTRKAQTPVSDG
jgi:endonuclease/exonuclease/phosphatase family metal-dependent hydrolase